MFWSSSTYDERLLSWVALRDSSASNGLEEYLTEVNDWWFQAPFVNRYIHPQDIGSWPTPWELLADNLYCELSRALGMMYTLMLTNHSEINDLAIMCLDNEYILSINTSKYLLNYQTNRILPTATENIDTAYIIVSSTHTDLLAKTGME